MSLNPYGCSPQVVQYLDLLTLGWAELHDGGLLNCSHASCQLCQTLWLLASRCLISLARDRLTVVGFWKTPSSQHCLFRSRLYRSCSYSLSLSVRLQEHPTIAPGLWTAFVAGVAAYHPLRRFRPDPKAIYGQLHGLH